VEEDLVMGDRVMVAVDILEVAISTRLQVEVVVPVEDSIPHLVIPMDVVEVMSITPATPGDPIVAEHSDSWGIISCRNFVNHG
jgi:hypothetical protein